MSTWHQGNRVNGLTPLEFCSDSIIRGTDKVGEICSSLSSKIWALSFWLGLRAPGTCRTTCQLTMACTCSPRTGYNGFNKAGRMRCPALGSMLGAEPHFKKNPKHKRHHLQYLQFSHVKKGYNTHLYLAYSFVIKFIWHYHREVCLNCKVLAYGRYYCSLNDCGLGIEQGSSWVASW